MCFFFSKNEYKTKITHIAVCANLNVKKKRETRNSLRERKHLNRTTTLLVCSMYNQSLHTHTRHLCGATLISSSLNFFFLFFCPTWPMYPIVYTTHNTYPFLTKLLTVNSLSLAQSLARSLTRFFLLRALCWIKNRPNSFFFIYVDNDYYFFCRCACVCVLY